MSNEEESVEYSTEEIPEEPTPITVRVTRTVQVDASKLLGGGKKVVVKSNQTGIRIAYTRKVKSSYYGNSKTESVTIPYEYFDDVFEVLRQVSEAKKEDAE